MTAQLRQDWSRRSRCIDGRPGENGCAKTGGLRAARGVGARAASRRGAVSRREAAGAHGVGEGVEAPELERLRAEELERRLRAGGGGVRAAAAGDAAVATVCARVSSFSTTPWR